LATQSTFVYIPRLHIDDNGAVGRLSSSSVHCVHKRTVTLYSVYVAITLANYVGF